MLTLILSFSKFDQGSDQQLLCRFLFKALTLQNLETNAEHVFIGSISALNGQKLINNHGDKRLQNESKNILSRVLRNIVDDNLHCTTAGDIVEFDHVVEHEVVLKT